jgi:hypothetical protein
MARFIAIQIKDAIKSFLADEARGLNDELGVSRSMKSTSVCMARDSSSLFDALLGIHSPLSVPASLNSNHSLLSLVLWLAFAFDNDGSSSYYLGTSALHIHLSLN